MKNVIDISNFTSVNDVNALKNYDGVLIMGTEGGDFVSPTLDTDVALCRQIGIPFGIYHVAGHIHTALEEYTFYKKIVGHYTDRTLKDCLDVENTENSASWIQQFLSYDNNMMFYANRNTFANSGVAKEKTWLCYPYHNNTDLDGFFGIQYRIDCNVQGVDNCDLSIFNDTVASNAIITKQGVVNMITLKVGSSSPSVSMLQAILNICVGAGLSVDGVYGSRTAAAVAKYQSAMNLPNDGIFGEQTRNCLVNDLLTSWFK